MSNNIDSVMRETRRYWYDDGFAELLIGLLFSIISAGLYLQYRATGNRFWLMVIIVGMMIVIFTSGFIIRWMLTQLKKTVTYPRTGYVEYSEQPDPNARRLALAVPMIVVVASLFMPNTFNVLGSGIGLTLGLFLTYIAYKTSVTRFTVAAVVSIGAGVASSYFVLNDIISTALVFGAVGIVLLITGAITLRTYLYQNPPVQDMD